MRLLIVALLIVSSIFLLAPEIKAEDNYKFQFAEDYIESLSLLKSGFVDAATVMSVTYDNDISKGVAIMKVYQSQNYNLRMAKDYISKYQSSSDELIKQAAQTALYSFGQQIEINNAAAEGYKKLNSPEVMRNNPSQFNQGEWMDKLGKLQAAKEQTLLMLIDATKLLTAVLVSKAPGEEGKMNYLVITAEQKDAILKRVEEIFGAKIKVTDLRDKNAGLETFDLCGVVLYRTFSQPYKTCDARPKGFKEPVSE